MPLVIVFTKFDQIVPKVSSNNAGGNDYKRVRVAYTAHVEQCRSLFRDVLAEIVSSDYSFVCVFFGEVVLRFVFGTAGVSRSYRQTSPNDRSTHRRPLAQNRRAVRSSEDTTTNVPRPACMVGLTESKPRH